MFLFYLSCIGVVVEYPVLQMFGRLWGMHTAPPDVAADFPVALLDHL